MATQKDADGTLWETLKDVEVPLDFPVTPNSKMCHGQPPMPKEILNLPL